MTNKKKPIKPAKKVNKIDLKRVKDAQEQFNKEIEEFNANIEYDERKRWHN